MTMKTILTAESERKVGDWYRRVDSPDIYILVSNGGRELAMANPVSGYFWATEVMCQDTEITDKNWAAITQGYGFTKIDKVNIRLD